MRTFERLRPRRSWLWPMLTATTVVVVVAAGAAAAIETDTVESFWRGLWWSISLVTTVGYIGAPPSTSAGQALSVLLMVTGFLLMAMVSASLAALFVREDEAPLEEREVRSEAAILDALVRVEVRMAALEARLAQMEASAGVQMEASAGARLTSPTTDSLPLPTRSVSPDPTSPGPDDRPGPTGLGTGGRPPEEAR